MRANQPMHTTKFQDLAQFGIEASSGRRARSNPRISIRKSGKSCRIKKRGFVGRDPVCPIRSRHRAYYTTVPPRTRQRHVLEGGDGDLSAADYPFSFSLFLNEISEGTNSLPTGFYPRGGRKKERSHTYGRTRDRDGGVVVCSHTSVDARIYAKRSRFNQLLGISH